MASNENIPAIIVSHSKREIRVHSDDRPEGKPVDEELSTTLNLHRHADVLGALSVRGTGLYTLNEISAALETNPHILRSTAKRLARLLPEYIAFGHDFEVKQDFSAAMALPQPGDREMARDSAASKRQEAQAEQIIVLQERLSELVAEMTYSEVDIAAMDEDKLDLHKFSSAQISFYDQEDCLINLTFVEDMVGVRILMDMKACADIGVEFEDSPEAAQRIWETMPQNERKIFSNSYRTRAPKVFTSTFQALVWTLASRMAIDRDSSRTYEQSMPRIKDVSLLAEEPTESAYDELLIGRHTPEKLPEIRYKQQVDDGNERKKIVKNLHALGVSTREQNWALYEKAKLRYSPESQIDLEEETARMVEAVIAGGCEPFTQPESLKLLYAVNNKRFYSAIETMASQAEQPMTLGEAIRKLEDHAKKALQGTYQGFATGRQRIGEATIKKLHQK